MKLTTMTRSLLRSLLAKFGYDLQIIGMPVRGFRNFLEFVKISGIKPATVFDIGVGYGTPWLYEAFPEARFVLIEPQTEFEPYLKRICESINAEYHLVGVGKEERSTQIYRPHNSPTGSSFLPPTKQAEDIWGTHSRSDSTMQIVKLDRFKDRNGPFLLKIDTEGFELEVLQGASSILENTDLVIMEVAVVKRHEGEADLIELGTILKKHGFRLMDIPVLTQQSNKGPLLYMDVAFVKSGSLHDISKISRN